MGGEGVLHISTSGRGSSNGFDVSELSTGDTGSQTMLTKVFVKKRRSLQRYVCFKVG
jgi:hypothetical protein